MTSNDHANLIVAQDSPWPHRLAVWLCCATFPLLFVGALVTTRQAGMAVPDWPTTFGYNLLLYPWQSWVAAPWNLFIEHGHRLLGALAGCLTIATCLALLRFDRREWLWAFGLFALALVISQGVLGGYRVRLDQRELARIHGCIGPLFFATAVALAVFTSRLWRSADDEFDKPSPSGRGQGEGQTARSKPSPQPSPQGRGREHAGAGRLHRLAWLTTILAYAQLVVGSYVRHVAITAAPGTFLIAVLFHLLLAAAVLVHAALLLVLVSNTHRLQPALLRPALGLALLVLVQILLGGASWLVKYGPPAGWFANWKLVANWTNTAGTMTQSMIVTAHVACGSLILAISLMIALRAARLVRRPIVLAPASAALVGVAR